MSGLAAILYHVKPDYQSSFNILLKHNNLQLNFFLKTTTNHGLQNFMEMCKEQKGSEKTS